MSSTRTALVTGAWGPGQEIAGMVAATLEAEGWHIRSTAPHRSDAGHWADHHVGDLRSPEFIEALLADLPGGGASEADIDPAGRSGGVIVVHLAPLVAVADAAIAHPGNPAEALDIATRGTYRLLMGCLSTGIGRVVQASSLSSFDAYEHGLEVTEQWRPRPGPNADDLAPYLAELTAREFTRDPLVHNPLEVTCLRLAALRGGDDSSRPPTDIRAMWTVDAARAIGLAIAAQATGNRGSDRGHRWRILHVASGAPDARYTSAIAHQVIGYSPAWLDTASTGTREVAR